MSWNKKILGFQLLNQRPKLYKFWLVLLVFLVIVGIILLFRSYTTFIECTGLVAREEDRFDVRILIQEDDIPYLSHHRVLIKGRIEQFQIEHISESYTVGNDGNLYREIFLTFPLLEEEKIENNILFLTFQKERMKGFQWLKKQIEKGFHNE